MRRSTFDFNIIIENLPRTPRGLAVFFGAIAFIIGAVAQNGELEGGGLVLALLGLLL